MGNCINSSLSKSIFHSQLGNMQKQYHQNYTIEYYKATTKLTSRQKYEKWASQVKRLRYNNEIKNFVYFPQKITVQQSDIFHNQSLIYIFYEPYIETLQDLIVRYKSKGQYASQEMIWYLIYCLTKVGKYFEKVNTKIGSIRLENIVITQNRQVKIICEKTTLEFLSPFEEARLKLSDKVLLAPEEIQTLAKIKKSSGEQVNPQLSQVFCIGILILSLANMTEPNKLYDYNFDSEPSIYINTQKIQTLLTNLKKNKKFSDLLIQTICQMIEVKPSKRIKSSQLHKRLSDYQNQILTKKGLHYSGQEIQKIKESLNGSLISKGLNNSMQTAGNRSFQNNTHSFRVSQITQIQDEGLSTGGKSPYLQQNRIQQSTDFVNIL